MQMLTVAAVRAPRTTLDPCGEFRFGQVPKKEKPRLKRPPGLRVLSPRECREVVGLISVFRPTIQSSLREIVSTFLKLDFKTKVEQIECLIEDRRHTVTWHTIEAIIDRQEDGENLLDTEGHPNIFFYRLGNGSEGRVRALAVQYAASQWKGYRYPLDTPRALSTRTRIYLRN